MICMCMSCVYSIHVIMYIFTLHGYFFFLIHVLLYCNHFLYSCVWHSKTLEACMKLSKFEEERSI